MKGEMTVEDVMEIGAELRRQAIASASVADLSEPLRKQAIANASVDDLSEPLRKQAIASASPEDRLAGLTPEQMADMLKQIEALLAMQATTPVRHRRRTNKR